MTPLGMQIFPRLDKMYLWCKRGQITGNGSDLRIAQSVNEIDLHRQVTLDPIHLPLTQDFAVLSVVT